MTYSWQARGHFMVKMCLNARPDKKTALFNRISANRISEGRYVKLIKAIVLSIKALMRIPLYLVMLHRLDVKINQV